MKSVAIAVLTFLGSTFAQQTAPETLYKNVVPSVITLRVEKKDGSSVVGSAFLITNSGIAGTAWHVVSGATHVAARFADGEQFEVSGLIDKDEKRDLALIRVKTFGRQEASVNPNEPQVGSKAYIIGAPLGLEFSITEGLVSQIQEISGTRQYQFSSPASPGNSGGPLLNDKGEVIGIVSWQVRDGQNLNFAIPSRYLLGLDKTLPTTPWDAVTPTRQTEFTTATDDQIDKMLARAYVALVDSGDALRFQILAERQKNGYRSGVDSWLYASQRELKSVVVLLKDRGSSDSSRNELGTQFLNACQSMIEAIDFMAQAVRVAQTSNGWTAEANDIHARAVAAFPQLFPPVKDTPIWRSATFQQNLPEVFKEKDESGFQLGVHFPVTRPRIILGVEARSLAEHLGIRPLDVLVSFAGKPIQSVGELKESIKQNRGTQTKLIVSRTGKSQALNAKIPVQLPKPQ